MNAAFIESIISIIVAFDTYKSKSFIIGNSSLLMEDICIRFLNSNLK